MKEANACGLHCTKINNISVNISGQEILKNVSIHVHCGQLTVIIGRNGAGKSTTISILSTILKNDAGKINIFNLHEGQQN